MEGSYRVVCVFTVLMQIILKKLVCSILQFSDVSAINVS